MLILKQTQILSSSYLLTSLDETREAIDLANQILSSGDFLVRFNQIKLTQNQGKTNSQVLHMILDQDVNLTIAFDSTSHGTETARTGNGIITLDVGAFQSLPYLTETLAHESTHVLGFTHAYLPARWYYPWGYRMTDVSYALGNLVGQIAKEKLTVKV